MKSGRRETNRVYSRSDAVRDAGKRLLQYATASFSTQLWRLAGQHPARSLNILCHHRVVPAFPGLPAPSWNVTPDRFRSQLVGLKEAGYTFWPLSQVLDAQARGESIPSRSVVVTFDDGYENNFTYAAPILREQQVPATIFLNTAYLDSQEPFPFEPWGVAFADRTPPEYWRPLSRTQCHEMLKSEFIEFGAHTHTHQDFRQRPQDFAEDLAKNVAELARDFGITTPMFAFPYGRSRMGYASEELIAECKLAGVRCALTTDSNAVEPGSDPHGWGRFMVYEWDTAATLSARFSGWNRWVRRIHEQWTCLADGVRECEKATFALRNLSSSRPLGPVHDGRPLKHI